MRTLYRARLLVLVAIAIILRLTVLAEPAAASQAPHTMLGVAALSTGALTALDIAKRLDPQGNVPIIAELLSQKNEILLDMQMIEGNLATGHRMVVRTSLPTAYWRLYNQGVAPSKSTTAQIDEHCGMLEAWSEVDKDLAELGGMDKVPQVRLSEAKAFIEGMNQEMASTLFYGSSLAPAEFIGLTARYAAHAGATNSDNVILGGGGGSDNTSIWLVDWSPESLFGIYPQGSKVGLIREDLGIETVETTAGIAGSRMRAYRERYQWKLGLGIKDYRYAVRCANIDISDLTGASAADLIAIMGDMEEIIPSRAGSRAFYMNRTVKRFLRRQVRDAVGTGGGLNYQNFAGVSTMMYGDTPIRVTDALLNNETLIS